MSLVPLLHLQALHLQASPSALAIGFSVLLVLSLVVAEEAEVRRGGASGRVEG